MGEYARIKGNNTKVKIGTCESMYYLRYEDRHKVDYSFVGNERFRLPFPDEDHIQIGHYDNAFRHYRLNADHYFHALTDEKKKVFIKNPGFIQMTTRTGLMCTAPCYHGLKLPKSAEGGGQFSWCKTEDHFVLRMIKHPKPGERPKAIIGCRGCFEEWACDLDDVIQFVTDEELRERLESYMEENAEVSA